MAEVLESFLCPLTRQPMKDPVMDVEGSNYERVAIEDWLSRTPHSPLTRTPLVAKDLIPNRFLRDAISEYCKLHKITIPQSIDVKKLPKFSPPASVAVAAQNKQEAKAHHIEQITLTLQSMKKTKTRAAVEADASAKEQQQGDNDVEEEECVVCASISPPQGSTRTPADIVCVIDISGSMGVNATIQNDAGGREDNNLSILDIVKHAVKTIIATLQPNDRLGLVSYSTKAKKVFDLLPMNAAGRAKAQKDLDTLDADGQTNLWEGLFTGLEILRKSSSSSNRLSTVLLLTDGQPNITPEKGHIPMLREYKAQYPALLTTINTFGFGYNLDSVLLREVCVEGSGMYAFIPDAGFVGTCFVNTMSNILVTVARNITLEITSQNGAEFIGAPGTIVTKQSENTHTISLGTLQYGQNREVTWRMRVPKKKQQQAAAAASASESKSGEEGRGENEVSAAAAAAESKSEGGEKSGESETQEKNVFVSTMLRYQSCNNAEVVSVNAQLSEQQQGDTAAVELHVFRYAFIDILQHALDEYKRGGGEDVKEGQRVVKSLKEQLKSVVNKHPHLITLLQDVEGQVTEAWSKLEWFKKWGVHYLPSLLRAHQLQQCNNFKDPGIQHYGGKLFNSVREEADDIFVKLPPPSQKNDGFDWSKWGDAPVVPRAAAAVDMRMYYNRSGGCIAGDCVMSMADGSSKRVSEIMKGDWVVSAAGVPARVLCVVQMLCENSCMDMVRLPGGLLITPFHPIWANSRWQFPMQIGRMENFVCESVFNFVLSNGHTVLVNDLECVTFGHNFTGEVVGHPYFGTPRIIKNLQKLRMGASFNLGFIKFKPNCLLRNDEGQVHEFDAACQL